MKKIIKVLAIILVLAMAMLATGYYIIKNDKLYDIKDSIARISNKSVTEEEKQKLKEEILSFEQSVNEDGMAIDMTNNPYFMEKHKGFEYPTPREITYYSGITKTDRKAYVLLPVGYNENEKYPVLYLLHGLGGSHKTWLNKHADIILYNLMQIYDVPDMIVVLPNSEVSTREDIDDLSIPMRFEIYDNTQEELIDYLMPYIEENYSVKTGRENTAIAGNSMGGRNTLYIAFNHQDMFGYVGIFSPAVVVRFEELNYTNLALLDDIDIDKDIGQFKYLLLCTGKDDSICGANTYAIHNKMNEKSIEHTFYDTEGGHENKVWYAALYNFGRQLWKN